MSANAQQPAEAGASSNSAAASPPVAADSTMTVEQSQAPPSYCSLHIRLFDGSSIKSRFNAEATLATAVRTFVAEQSDTDAPYNFRLMDLPRPSRTIEISEEGQSLKELGLCPNATLVLVPVKDFTDAYAIGGGMGVVHKGVSMGWNIASGAASLVGGVIGRLTGIDPGDKAREGPYIAGTGDNPDHLVSRSSEQKPETPTPGNSGVKVTTLAEQRKTDTIENYNGNQLSVEPRPEDK